jgi:hypothetical protein
MGKQQQIMFMHLNLKKDRLIIITKEGIILYRIEKATEQDYKIIREKSLFSRRELKTEGNQILDAKWSIPFVMESSTKEFILFSSKAKHIKLYDPIEGKIVKAYNKCNHKATVLQWNPLADNNEFFLSGHENGTILYWQKDSEAAILEFHFMRQNNPVKALAFNPRIGKLFSCGHQDGKFFIWKISDPYQHLIFFQPDSHAVVDIEYHAKEQGVVMIGSKTIQIFKIKSDNKLDKLQNIHTFRGQLNCLRWRPKYNDHVSYATDNSIIIFNLQRPFLYHYIINVDIGQIVKFEWIENDTIIIASKKVN